jgi:hypothetical protein
MSVEKDREPLATTLSQVVMPAGAVFLSYASQDAQAAQKICDALRAAGIEAWFDQSELRGAMRGTGAYVTRSVIARSSCQSFPRGRRREQRATFRLEWHLAEQRTHLIGRQRAFLVPVCIDDTEERDADVPDAFFRAS